MSDSISLYKAIRSLRKMVSRELSSIKEMIVGAEERLNEKIDAINTNNTELRALIQTGLEAAQQNTAALQAAVAELTAIREAGVTPEGVARLETSLNSAIEASQANEDLLANPPAPPEPTPEPTPEV